MLALTLMLLLGLDFGGDTFPWNSPKVIVLIVVGALMSVVFVYSEKRLAKYPLIPMTLFKNRSNIASILVTFLHGMVFIGPEYYMPLYFQSTKGASPLRSGVLLLPLIVFTATAGIIAGVIIHRTGRYRELIWSGTVVLTIGLGLFVNFGANSSTGMILGFELVVGVGSGLLFEAPLIAIQSLVAQDDVATATSTFSFARNLATSMSVIIGGVIFQNSMDLQAASLRAAGLSDDALELLSGKNAAANVMLSETLTDPAKMLAVKEAFAWSMRNMWILYTCLSFLTVIAGAFITRQDLSKEHTETVTGIKKEPAGN